MITLFEVKVNMFLKINKKILKAGLLYVKTQSREAIYLVFFLILEPIAKRTLNIIMMEIAPMPTLTV